MSRSLHGELDHLREQLARAQVANATLEPVQMALSQVTSELELKGFLAEVLSRAVAMVGAEAGALLLLDREEHRLKFAVVHGGGSGMGRGAAHLLLFH